MTRFEKNGAAEILRALRALPSLAAAILCMGLIVEAIVTALGARANGDAMVMVCPILGAIFLTIPAGQACWACWEILWRK